MDGFWQQVDHKIHSKQPNNKIMCYCRTRIVNLHARLIFFDRTDFFSEDGAYASTYVMLSLFASGQTLHEK